MTANLTDDERDAVDALIEYRLRLADKPFIKPMSMTPALKSLSDGVLARDYPLIIGIILIVSIAVVLVNLITDVIYAIVDPRIRYN